jgi:hypothetical protein
MDYQFANTRGNKHTPIAMDLLTAERLNGRAWNWAKVAAFACFLVASALLVASLLGVPPDDMGGDGAAKAHIVSPR